MTKEQSRQVEKKLEIAAPVEAVWKALTNAEELTNWFPLHAKVKPDVGGSIWISWGEDWWQNSGAIEIWEPNKHLRWHWDAKSAEVAKSEPENIQPTSTVLDFYLEGKGGETMLRVVHSGFGRGANWDDMYDAVNRGWSYELRSLKVYLEHHQGEKRHVALVKREVDMTFEAAWAKVMSTDGILAKGGLKDLKAGDRYSIVTSEGDAFEGTVMLVGPPNDAGLIVDRLNGALFRVHIDHACSGGGKCDVSLWLAAWKMNEAEVNAYGQRFEKILRRLF